KQRPTRFVPRSPVRKNRDSARLLHATPTIRDFSKSRYRIPFREFNSHSENGSIIWDEQGASVTRHPYRSVGTNQVGLGLIFTALAAESKIHDFVPFNDKIIQLRVIHLGFLNR